MSRRVIFILVIFLLVGLLAYLTPRRNSEHSVSIPSDPVMATFSCAEKGLITTTFMRGAQVTVPAGEPPVPTGSVVLVFADGHTASLAQTLSADGSRYANPDESVILWNKGRAVLYDEKGKEERCVEVVANPGGLDQVYASGTLGISLRYPSGYTLDPAFLDQSSGTGKDIAGVRLSIPGPFASGTNLSVDSAFRVEYLPQATECTATAFLPQATSFEWTDGEVRYSVASSTDAGAGNRYEETVFALPDSSPCIAIRYFVHYGVFENYPKGSILHFDRAALAAQFDAIRRTLVVAQ